MTNPLTATPLHDVTAHVGEIRSYLLGQVPCRFCGASHHASARECPCGRCTDCGLRGCHSEACAEQIGIESEHRAQYLARLARFGLFVAAALPKAADLAVRIQPHVDDDCRSLDCLGFALAELSVLGAMADAVEGFRLFNRIHPYPPRAA